MGEWIELEALDGEGRLAAWLAEPEGPPRAAIIVIQEIFGVNPGIRRKADDWATRGYLAIAPDMFWRFAPRFEADPDVEAEKDTRWKSATSSISTHRRAISKPPSAMLARKVRKRLA